MMSSTASPSANTRVEPRHTRVGGFVMSPETAAAWALRLTGKEYHPTKYCFVIRNLIHEKVKQYSGRFEVLGEDWPTDFVFMVVTQAERFNGYKGMDPSMIPKFEEGIIEAKAQELLAEEGRCKVCIQ